MLVDQGAPTPDVPTFSDLVNLQYIRREPNGHLLVGNSDHSNPEIADPDAHPNRATEDFVETAIGRLDRILPDMPDPRLASSYAGCYDITPDYNPIIGPSPAAGLFLAVGFSGHGFKISPAVGVWRPIYCSTGSAATPPSTGTTSATAASARASHS